MNREELDAAIVGAVDTYKAEKREELVKAVEDAEVAARDYAADDSWSALMAAKNALTAHDKEYKR